jgi:hypothetical protein
MLDLRKSCLIASFCVAASGIANAAPAQLKNKTIAISWTNSGSGTRADGTTVNFNNQVHRTIYVSSQGRLFIRSERATARGKHSTTKDIAPGDRVSGQGLARDARFQGDRLVGTMAFASGAGQFVVTFSGGFSSCAVSVVFGKSGGAGLRMRGPDKQMYDIKSIAANGPNCSIREGNPFAS